MIERLADMPHVRIAALIGEKFKIDPITVLKSSYMDWAIRNASYNFISEREAEAARKQAAQQAAKRNQR